MTDLLEALSGYAWPVVLGVIVWRLLPTIREVINSRGFTIKAGSTEITVQQASDQMLDRVEDLREQLSALKAQVGGAGGGATREIAPAASGVERLRRVLWVDDHPENNAYEVEALQRKGVAVALARSTAEGLRAASDELFDAIVTDMGRKEDGRDRPDAGMELIEELREREVPAPVVVYASAQAVHRTRERFEGAGAQGTASATELLEMLGTLGGAPDGAPLGRSGGSEPSS